MTRAYFRFLSGVVMVVTGLAMGVPRSTPLRAQAPAPERPPRFDVASVKPHMSGDGRTRMQTLLHKSNVDCDALFAARQAGVLPPPRQCRSSLASSSSQPKGRWTWLASHGECL